MRPGEPENSIVIGDPSTFTEIHSEPLTTLEDGLKTTIEYFRTNYL